MEIEKSQQPKLGHWDNLDTSDRKPNVVFEFNKPEVVSIQCDAPREIQWEDGVFYIFDVIHNGEEKVIKTSAFTLLKGLKAFEPLNQKILKIEKIMEKGKQIYKVGLNEEKVE